MKGVCVLHAVMLIILHCRSTQTTATSTTTIVQLAVVLFMSMKSRIRDHPENDRVLRVE